MSISEFSKRLDDLFHSKEGQPTPDEIAGCWPRSENILVNDGELRPADNSNALTVLFRSSWGKADDIAENPELLIVDGGRKPPPFYTDRPCEIYAVGHYALLVDFRVEQLQDITDSDGPIKISGKGNIVRIRSGSFANDIKAINIYGKDNIVYISHKVITKRCAVDIRGDNNILFIGFDSNVAGTFSINGSGSSIRIGDNVKFTSQHTHLSVQENEVCISIPRGSLIGETKIRTSDSHSIIEEATGKRINPAASVLLGRYTWTAQSVRILKGVRLADHTIVGTGSIVTRSFQEPKTVIVGSPANVVRRGVIWDAKRLTDDG